MTALASQLARGREKLSPQLVVAVSSWFSRIFVALSQFLALRVLLQSVGVEGYAIFAVITGLAGWFSLFDFGIGVSLQNFISERTANGQAAEVANLATAGRLLAVGALGVALVFLLVLSRPLADFLLEDFPSLTSDAKKNLVFYGGMFLAASGASGVVYKIWYAEHRGYLANLMPAAAALLGLVDVYLCKYSPSEGRLLASVVAYVVPVGLLPLLILLWQLRSLSFSVGKADLVHGVRPLLTRAVGFWFFALMAAITLQTDYVVMSKFASARDIAVYAIVSRIFGLAFFIYNAVLLAHWPVMTELQAQRQWAAMRLTIRSNLRAGMVGMALFTLVAMAGMPYVIDLLAPGKKLSVPWGVVLAFGAYQLLRVWTDTYSMLIQSMSRTKVFWMTVPVQALLSAVLQWVLVPRLGIYGVISGLVISFLLTVSWILPVAFSRYTRKI